MDMHMMHSDLAAQAQQPGAAQQPPPPVGTAPQGPPHGGSYHAALQPSHQPSQHQHHQQQQHHYPPSSSPTSSLPTSYGTARSPSASSAASSAPLGGSAAISAVAPPAPPAPPPPPPPAASPPSAPAGRLGHTLHTMQQTGFHAWGFVIYRGCAYDDEPLWQRFLQHMRQEVHNALAATPRLPGGGGGSALDNTGRQLAPYLEWTVMEDPWLEGASTETVRRHFAAWAAARSPRRDGPGADGPFIESHVPRFMYCVYVDRRCLRTLAAFDDWLRLDRNGPMQYLACALIDKNCPPQGEGEPGMAPVDGCDRYYTGWMYAHVGSLPELYNTLGHQRLISGPNNYARPPRIYPGHLYGASVPL